MEEFIRSILKAGLGGLFCIFPFFMVFVLPRLVMNREKKKKIRKENLHKKIVAFNDRTIPRLGNQLNEGNSIVKKENCKMFCQHCGKELSQYADVCLNCGAFVSEIVKKKNVSKTDPSSPVYNVINIAVFVLSIIESLILSIFSAIGETFFIYSDIYYTRKGNEAHLGHSYIDFRYTAIFVSSIVVISTLLLVSLTLYGKTKSKIAAASIFITLGAIIVSMIFTFITVAAY